LFSKRIFVVVEDVLGERAKKKLFSHNKKYFAYRLAYPEDAHFPICFLFTQIAQGVGKRTYADLKE
jgi:hypothetical protein